MSDVRVVFFLLLLAQAWISHADDGLEISGQIKSEDETFQTVWIGVGTNKETSQWNWISVDSQEFNLKVPNAEEVSLVALRKNSVPLVLKIAPSGGEAYVEVEFERGHSVQTTVKSADGFEVENAILTLQPIGLSPVSIPENARTSWTSDSSGSVTIGGLVEGEHTVYVSTSHLPIQEFSVLAGKQDTAVQDFVLDDAYFIAGRVVDQEGHPVVGAEIQAALPERRRDPLLPNGVSIDDGSFAHGPFPKSWILHVMARDDQARSSRERTVYAGTHQLELHILNLTHVVGFVSDADTGEPIEDFTLWLTPSSIDQGLQHLDTGGILSAYVNPRTAHFVIDAPEYNAHFELRVALEAGGEFDLGEIQLQRGRVLTGRVFDRETLDPIEGVEISLTGQPKKGQTYGYRENFMTGYLISKVTARSNSVGEFSLGPFPHDAVVVRSFSENYQTEEWQVRAGQKTLELPLRRWDRDSTRIFGQVKTTSGEPVQGWLTRLNRDLREGRGGCDTDLDGTFDCAIGIGRYSVTAETKFGETNTVNLNVKNGQSYEVRLIVEAIGRVSGVVDGLMHGETADLAVSSIEGEKFRRAWQDLDGAYDNGEYAVQGEEIRRASRVKNGEYVIEGIGEGEFTLSATTSLHRKLTRTFEVFGEDGTTEVNLVFEGSSRLHGRIIESSWGSNLFFEIRAQPKNTDSASASGWVNDDRTYEIHGLEDGTYTVGVWRVENHGSLTTQSLAARKSIDISGDTSLDFQLSTLFVAGNVFLDGDLSMVSVDLIGQMEESGPRYFGKVNGSGEFRLEGVQPGEYRLRVMHDDFEPYKDTLSVVTSVEGLQIELTPRTEGNLVLAGTVNPVGASAGALVRLQRGDDGQRLGSVTVDETGAFQFDSLHAGEYLVNVDHDDFLFFQTNTSLEDSRFDFMISLRPKGTLFLEGTLEPAEASAGAAVSLWRSDTESSGDSFVGTVTTDQWGRFRFEELPPDDYSIWVSHKEFEFVEQFVTLKQSATEYNISLQPRELEQH